MGLFGSIAGGNTSNSQTNIHEDTTSQYGNVIGGTGGIRGRGNTVNLGTGNTIGTGFGSKLTNVGNNAGSIIKLNNQIGNLTNRLAQQQKNLSRFKTGSPGYNTVSRNITATQGKLASIQSSLKAISNLNINASTNLTINPSLDTGLSQITTAVQNALAANAAFNLTPGNPTSTNSVISGPVNSSGGTSANIAPNTAIGSGNTTSPADLGAGAGLQGSGQSVESPTIAGMDTTQLLVIAAGIGLVVLLARKGRF